MATEYEMMLLVQAELDDAARTAIVDKAQAIVTKGKGTWNDTNEWGRRTLAYEINHKNEAWYYLMRFAAEAEILDDLVRQLRITDGVVRVMAVHRVPESEVPVPEIEKERPRDRGRGGKYSRSRG
jgi:small subunit ribosomal protein S6